MYGPILCSVGLLASHMSTWIIVHNSYNYFIAFWKTDHLRTRTEIHILPVHDRHILALSSTR